MKLDQPADGPIGGPHYLNSREAAWAHSRTSSWHPSPIGPRARPSYSTSPRSSYNPLRIGAIGAEERHWVADAPREKRYPRPTRLELEGDVPAPLLALLLPLFCSTFPPVVPLPTPT